MKKLRIAVNTRLLLKDKLEGIGRFSHETLRRVVASHPEVEFYFLFDRKYHPDFVYAENVTPVVLFPPARHSFLFVVWFEIAVSRWLKKHKPDLFFSPDGFLPLRSDVKSISVIHDINFEHNPKALPFFARHYYRYFFPRFARKAQKVLTVSQYSAQDIHQTYSIDREKIDVVYNGVDESFYPENQEGIQKLKSELNIKGQYFLYVGSLHARKNVDGLIKAYSEYKKSRGESRLVIAGAAMWGDNEYADMVNNLGLESHVIFTGRLNNDALRAIYSDALAFVMVSHFEGFGIPVIEAMACACPVICSNTTSLPEVGGEAAIQVSPHDFQQISDAMLKIEQDKELRQAMIKKGFEQARKFTWDEVAFRCWKTIEAVL